MRMSGTLAMVEASTRLVHAATGRRHTRPRKVWSLSGACVFHEMAAIGDLNRMHSAFDAVPP
jgi:hypothetical protein